MSEITRIMLEMKNTHAIYNDCDSMTDYFHSTSGSLKYICERVKEKGAKKINVIVLNNNPDTPALNRINKICKMAGYKAINKSYPAKRTYSRYPDNIEVIEDYTHLEWELIKAQ